MPEQFEQPPIIIEQVEQLLDEVDSLLSEGRFQSIEEKDLYLRKLYGLRAVSNDKRIQDLIRYIETEYGT
ncbi:MAG: hypothetical protein RL097_358 [Candidatus Parcubacteria bacterium]